MNWLDIIILIPIAFFAWQGLKNGLIMEIFTLAALILGIWASLEFAYVAEDFMRDQFNWKSEFLHIISFIVTFIIVVIAVNLIGKIISKLFHAVALGPVDKILGLAFGAVKAILLLTVIVFIFNDFSGRKGIIDKEVKNESFCYPLLEDLSEEMEKIVDDREMPDLRKQKEKLEDVVEETFNT
jgi:membrane protein required for colicin V production